MFQRRMDQWWSDYLTHMWKLEWNGFQWDVTVNYEQNGKNQNKMICFESKICSVVEQVYAWKL